MGEGIVFSTVFFWRLRPEIGSNCHPVGSSSKTPSDALQTFSMETGQAGGESAAECGSGGRFSAGGRFYQVKSAIEHNGHYARRVGRRGGTLLSVVTRGRPELYGDGWCPPVLPRPRLTTRTVNGEGGHEECRVSKTTVIHDSQLNRLEASLGIVQQGHNLP